jgi:hypothetical protein
MSLTSGINEAEKGEIKIGEVNDPRHFISSVISKYFHASLPSSDARRTLFALPGLFLPLIFWWSIHTHTALSCKRLGVTAHPSQYTARHTDT